MEAIVSTVSKSVLSPCLNTNETVSVVPVEGAHVMLNGVPAVMLVRDVKVNGFWADARAATAARMRVVENCILAFFYLFLDRLIERDGLKVVRSGINNTAKD